jgi:hypothetical protein
MYFHVYLIYRFTRTFTDHSSVITKCWGFELQKRKIEPQKPANPCDTRLCSCIFFVNTLHDGAKIPLLRRFFAEKRPARFGKVEETCGSGGGILCRKGPVARARLGRYFASFVKHRTVVVISPITAKMPSIPCPVMSSAISRFVISFSSLTHELRHEIEDHAACEHRCDLAGDVRADGVHQQVVGAVRLLPHLLDNARGHREGRDTGRTDHRIHLVLAEEVQKLCKHHARDGVKDEGDKTQRHDDERFEIDELVGLHREGDRDAEKQRDEVGKVVLRRLREAFEAAALAQQVAEHQKTDERDGHRRDEARDDRDHDGEADAQRAGDVLGIVGHV